MKLSYYIVSVFFLFSAADALAWGPHCGKEFKDAKQACKDANLSDQEFIDCIKQAWSDRTDCREGRLACRSNFLTDQRSCLEANNDLKGVRTCFKDARNVKKDCLESGGPIDNGQCIATCDATRDSAHSACDVQFDIAVCGGDPACESQILTLNQQCKDTATAEHAVCVQSCQ